MTQARDRIAAHLAAHGGVATRDDLVELGASRRTIERCVADGYLARHANGVVGLGATATDIAQRERAAVLGHIGAVLGYSSAARHHGLTVPVTSDIELVVRHSHNPGPSTAREDGLRLHQTRRLTDHDIVEIGRPTMLATSPARTIVDLASVLGPLRLRWLCESALRDDITTAPAIEAAAGVFRRGRKGLGALRTLLPHLADMSPVTGSELEQAMRRVLVDAAIPGVVEQFMPPWFDGVRGIVDFAIPSHRLVIEVDGRRWHTLSQNMEEDRRRDRIAAANGWLVLRFTWAEVTQRPSDVIESIRAVLGHRELTSPDRSTNAPHRHRPAGLA